MLDLRGPTYKGRDERKDGSIVMSMSVCLSAYLSARIIRKHIHGWISSVDCVAPAVKLSATFAARLITNPSTQFSLICWATDAFWQQTASRSLEGCLSLVSRGHDLQVLRLMTSVTSNSHAWRARIDVGRRN